jgi:hypothetical protein
MRIAFVLLAFVLTTVSFAPVFADSKADHAALADSANKLSASAATVAKTAKAADDRGARKKFAPAAQDLADDLAAFARRAGKDLPFKSLASDASALVKDANALVELADEIEDKDERKSLRGSATLLVQGTEGLGKQLVAATANEDKGGAKPAQTAARRFTGLFVNNSDKCSWEENVFFQIVRNGQVIYKTQLVFPGRTSAVALEEGQYVVQILKTAGELHAQKTLDAKAENWQLATGCMN